MSLEQTAGGILIPASGKHHSKSASGLNIIELDDGWSLGAPEPVLDSNGVLDYLHCYWNGEYWEPPVDRYGLNRLRHASVYHPSAMQAKINMVMGTTEIVDKSMITYDDIEALISDLEFFGDFHVQGILSRTKKVVRLKHAHSIYTRRLEDKNQFGFVRPGEEMHTFKKGAVLQVRKFDTTQEMYGLPGYLASINAILLKENALLFRRKYYKNNAHMGFILYISDPAIGDPAIDKIEKSLKDAKGPGNFKNMVIHSPNGDKDAIQLVSVSEFAAKDEFLNVNRVAMADQLAIHRVPWQLMGILPDTNTPAGNMPDVATVFAMNEIKPFHRKLDSINQFAGKTILKFHDYTIPTAASAA